MPPWVEAILVRGGVARSMVAVREGGYGYGTE